MCYNYLSILNHEINDEKIEKLKKYFMGLTPNNRDLITVSKVANALDVDDKKAVRIILKCEEEGILQRHFGIRCPNCGMLIKEISEPNIDDIVINQCYSCDEEIEISNEDIVILFELVRVELPFEEGQQSKQIVKTEASIVARIDTFAAFEIMCDNISEEIQRKRVENYEQKIKDEKKKVVHDKAVRNAEVNRRINIALKIICILVDISVIFLVYNRYGFEKISVFITFGGFAVQFICNSVINELFITDIARIEEKIKQKTNL